MKKGIYMAVPLLLFAMVGCGEKESEQSAGNQGGSPTPVQSVIVQGTIATIDDVHGIDLDNDGAIDFRIGDSYYPANIYDGNLAFNYEVDGRNIVVKGTFVEGGWDIIKSLQENDIINAESNFSSEGDASIDNIDLVPATRYAGLRIKKDDGLHYGWAKAEITAVEGEPGQYRAEWTECCYNAAAGTSIAAGQVR